MYEPSINLRASYHFINTGASPHHFVERKESFGCRDLAPVPECVEIQIAELGRSRSESQTSLL